MKCEYCNNEHDGSYASGRFCSLKCATSYSSNTDNKKETKKSQCIICGKEIIINKRASANNAKCDECKKIKEPKKCKYCGLYKCIRPDICSKHQGFTSLIKYFGFDKNVIGTTGVYKEFERIQNIVYEDYYDKKLSTIDMTLKYNHNANGNFIKILHYLGLECRNLLNSQLNAWNSGKIGNHIHSRYKNGWHKTWNDRNVYYRSSYELEYAQYLDENKIDYYMENLRLLYWDTQLTRQRVAIPDFYLSKTNTIVEIKSTYTFNKQNMIDRVKTYNEHGYKFKLILNKEDVDLGTL